MEQIHLLDYPNTESWKKHNKAKEKGLINKGAAIGSEIGIHGTLTGESYLIDRGINWTAGCISVKRKDVDEIYGYLKKGTQVIIKH